MKVLEEGPTPPHLLHKCKTTLRRRVCTGGALRGRVVGGYHQRHLMLHLLSLRFHPPLLLLLLLL